MSYQTANKCRMSLCSLPNYVREQISLTVAVMYKRGAIGETRLLNRQTIYDNLLHSITSGDSDMVL